MLACRGSEKAPESGYAKNGAPMRILLILALCVLSSSATAQNFRRDLSSVRSELVTLDRQLTQRCARCAPHCTGADASALAELLRTRQALLAKLTTSERSVVQQLLRTSRHCLALAERTAGGRDART